MSTTQQKCAVTIHLLAVVQICTISICVFYYHDIIIFQLPNLLWHIHHSLVVSNCICTYVAIHICFCDTCATVKNCTLLLLIALHKKKWSTTRYMDLICGYQIFIYVHTCCNVQKYSNPNLTSRLHYTI